MSMVSTENVKFESFGIEEQLASHHHTYWSSTTTSLRFVCVLASRRAKSLASDPELTKKHTLSGGGSRLVSLSAYRTRLS